MNRRKQLTPGTSSKFREAVPQVERKGKSRRSSSSFFAFAPVIAISFAPVDHLRYQTHIFDIRSSGNGSCSPLPFSRSSLFDFHLIFSTMKRIASRFRSALSPDSEEHIPARRTIEAPVQHIDLFGPSLEPIPAPISIEQERRRSEFEHARVRNEAVDMEKLGGRVKETDSRETGSFSPPLCQSERKGQANHSRDRNR